MRPRQLFLVLGLGVALASAQTGLALAQGDDRAAAPAAEGQVSPDAGAPSPDDPFERFNRRQFDTAMKLNKEVLRPVGKVYRALTPGFIGTAIHNMVTNLSEPQVVFNDVLQARFKDAGRDTIRIVADTLAGFGGMLDVAGRAGLPHHDNDFGVTLGVWGVAPGPYLFLPVIGPSTVRDAVGVGADAAMDPLNYMRFPGRVTLDVSSQVVGMLDKQIRSQAELNDLISTAADPYATVRSVYLQERQAQIRGENAAPVLAPLDEDPPPAAAPAPEITPPPPASAPSPSSSRSPSAALDPPSRDADRFAADDLDRPMMTAQPCDAPAGALLAANG